VVRDVQAAIWRQTGEDCLWIRVARSFNETEHQLTSSKESSWSPPRVEKYFIAEKMEEKFDRLGVIAFSGALFTFSDRWPSEHENTEAPLNILTVVNKVN